MHVKNLLTESLISAGLDKPVIMLYMHQRILRLLQSFCVMADKSRCAK